jgi:APA family basic amino acid/polyamine antiporter
METTQTTAETQSAEKNKLLRILGIGFGLAVVVGGMIGVGILRTPGIVAANVGSVWLILAVWVFGGIYTLIAANSYAELGTMLPKAGGPYVFAQRTYGAFGGFVIGWSDWFLNTCATAYLAVAASEYCAALFPALADFVPLVAVAILLFFSVLHWFGVRAGSGAQKLTSLLKVVFFFVLIAACFIFGERQNLAEFGQTSKSLFANPMTAFVAVILSLQAVVETYAGYNSVVYFSEENTNPSRNIPRSLFGGVLTVTAIYLLVNLALLYVLPVSTIADSKLPAADAASSVFGETGGTIITVLSLVSLLSIVNAIIMQTPRTLFAMSRDGLFSIRAATVNKGGTPAIALILTVLLAIVLAASGTFESLFAITAFMGVTVDCSVFLALLVLRKTEPDLPRPFKARGYPALPLFILIFSVLLLIAYVISNTMNSLFALTIMALSYPIFLIVRTLNKKREAGSF